MSAVADVLGSALVVAGAAFILVGTIGLLRLPDLATRLHAVAKADILGLGLLVSGLVILAADDGDWGTALKLALIWALAAIGSAANGHLLPTPPGGDAEGAP